MQDYEVEIILKINLHMFREISQTLFIIVNPPSTLPFIGYVHVFSNNHYIIARQWKTNLHLVVQFNICVVKFLANLILMYEKQIV